jgi:hypothetical protein
MSEREDSGDYKGDIDENKLVELDVEVSNYLENYLTDENYNYEDNNNMKNFSEYNSGDNLNQLKEDIQRKMYETENLNLKLMEENE